MLGKCPNWQTKNESLFMMSYKKGLILFEYEHFVYNTKCEFISCWRFSYLSMITIYYIFSDQSNFTTLILKLMEGVKLIKQIYVCLIMYVCLIIFYIMYYICIIYIYVYICIMYV